jgi:hypothetical protein
MGQILLADNANNFTHVSDLAFTYRTDLMDKQRFNGDGFSIKCNEFHLETLPVLVRHDDRPNVTGFQSQFRNVFIKNHLVKFVYGHFKKEKQLLTSEFFLCRYYQKTSRFLFWDFGRLVLQDYLRL